MTFQRSDPLRSAGGNGAAVGKPPGYTGHGGLERPLANLRITPATVVLERPLANLRVTLATVVLERPLANLRVTPDTVVLERALANLPWKVSRSRNSA